MTYANGGIRPPRVKENCHNKSPICPHSSHWVVHANRAAFREQFKNRFLRGMPWPVNFFAFSLQTLPAVRGSSIGPAPEEHTVRSRRPKRFVRATRRTNTDDRPGDQRNRG